MSAVLRTIIMLMGRVVAVITGAGFSNGFSSGFAASATTGVGVRTMLFPSLRVRMIQRWAGAIDDAWANAHISDIDGGTLTSHPNAICVEHYGLLLTSESNGENDFNGTVWHPPSDSPLVLFLAYADAYAAAHGDNVEDYWMHARAGQPNCVSGIYNISAAGVISFYYLLPGGGPVSSYPFTPGQMVTLSGLTAGNGTYPIASIQKFGITLTGWSAGALGPTGVNGHTKIGTVSTIGDGTLTKANRIQFFGWASWVLQCSFLTAGAKAMHAQRFADNRGDTNCVMIDNMASGANYNSMTVSQEYGAQTFDTNVPPQRTAARQFITDVSACLTGILAKPGGPTLLRINTAGYTFPDDTTLSRAARGVHAETSMSVTTYDMNVADWVGARAAEGIDVEFSNGDTWTTAAQNGGVTPDPGVDRAPPSSYNAGHYATPTARLQMSYWCLYQLKSDPVYIDTDGSKKRHLIFAIDNGFAVGQGPLSTLWQVGFETDIGQPFGTQTSVVQTDTLGNALRACTRKFSHDGGVTLSAVVVLTMGTGSNGNYFGDSSMSATALPAAPAGKQWFKLLHDGTFVLPASQVTVSTRRGEGVCMVAR